MIFVMLMNCYSYFFYKRLEHSNLFFILFRNYIMMFYLITRLIVFKYGGNVTVEQQELKRDLKNRHVQLIAIGGTIGTGLFLGSGKAIQLAGPSIIFAYLIVGIALFFVMRALGELLLSNAGYQSFTDFADGLYWTVGRVCDWMDVLVLLDYDSYGRYYSCWCIRTILVRYSAMDTSFSLFSDFIRV